MTSSLSASATDRSRVVCALTCSMRSSLAFAWALWPIASDSLVEMLDSIRSAIDLPSEVAIELAPLNSATAPCVLSISSPSTLNRDFIQSAAACVVSMSVLRWSSR